MHLNNWIKISHYDIISPSKGGDDMYREDENMTDKQLRYINRLTVFVRKLLKLVPQEQRESLENEFDSILLEVTKPDNDI